jgi:hypothetical protein
MAFKETYNIDAKQAEAALRGLTGDQERLAKASEDATKKLSAEDKAARRLAEAADPMKKFNRELEQTAVLVGKGKVSFEDANLHLGKYAERMSGAGKAQEAAFGQRAISSLASYAAGFATVGTVVSGVSSVLAEMEKNAVGAASRMRESLDVFGEMQQISGWMENREFVREMRSAGVVADDKIGGLLANNMDQAGFNDAEQRFIAYDLVGTGFLPAEDAAAVSTQIGKARDMLRIKDLEVAFQKITEAGGATDASNPEVAGALTSYAAQFMDLGFSADETLTAIIPASKSTKNIATAAELLKSFGDQVSKRGIGKGGLLDTIKAIKAQEDAGTNVYDILGESNAVRAYRMFDEASEQSRFNKSMDLVRTADERDVLGQQIGAMMEDGPTAAAFHARRSGRRLAYGRENRLGEMQNLFESARDDAVEYFENRGMTGGALFTGAKAWAYQKVSDQRVYLQDAMREEDYREKTFKDGGAFSKDFEQQVIAFLERTATASERTSNSVEGGTRANAE